MRATWSEGSPRESRVGFRVRVQGPRPGIPQGPSWRVRTRLADVCSGARITPATTFLPADDPAVNCAVTYVVSMCADSFMCFLPDYCRSECQLLQNLRDVCMFCLRRFSFRLCIVQVVWWMGWYMGSIGWKSYWLKRFFLLSNNLLCMVYFSFIAIIMDKSEFPLVVLYRVFR